MVKDVKAKVDAKKLEEDAISEGKSEGSKGSLPIGKIEYAINEERPSIYVKEDPEAGAETGKQQDREVENGATNQLEKTSLKSEKSEAKSNVDVKLRLVNYGASIPAKEDPEAGAEAGKQRDPEVENVTTNQRVREVFHMDVAELIIERNA